MAEYITYLDGGQTNIEGHNKFLNRFFSAGIPTFFSTTSLQVSQRGAGANMSVDVAVGDVQLSMPTGSFALWGYTDAVKNVAISAANATNPRIDAIIVYGDINAFTPATSNNPGALKVIAVAGTPAATPAAPSTAAIQTAIGGSNVPYQILANVAVAANATQITTANITDTRTGITSKVTTPSSALYNPYKFRGYLAGAQSTTGGAFVRIGMDAESYDTSDNLDITTNKGRFTAPIAGLYQFNASTAIAAAGNTAFMIALYKNGGAASLGNEFNASATGSISSMVSDCLKLAANDYVEPYVFCNGTVNLATGPSASYFSGFLVSAT